MSNAYRRLRTEMEPYLKGLNRKLRSSRYLAPAQIESYGLEVRDHLHTFKEDEQLNGCFIIIDFLYGQAKGDGQWASLERRFNQFFDTVTHQMYESSFSKSKKLKTRFAKTLGSSLIASMEDEHAPYSRLFYTFMKAFSADQIDKLDHYFHEHDMKKASRSFSITMSYFFLYIGKESLAKSLMQQAQPLTPDEAVAHLSLLTHRERYEQVLSWFETFFPNKTDKLGVLQDYYDQSASLHHSSSIQYETWDRWLKAPSFKRFQTLMSHYSEQQKELVLDYLLPPLERRLFSEANKLVYAQILIQYPDYDRTQQYFLQHETNPLDLHEQKQQLLEQLVQERPALSLPVVHQFIIRLAEKRTRKYYVEAAEYVEKLASIYKRMNKTERYQQYKQALYKRYQSYRAFIEELKRREPIIHMDS
ncbi:hypothetical protein ACE1TH_02770 [Shouchella sp. JSM 1781072]|uniref:hypothetical protein n=1 Tax=Bacillaceae TaxID=186817 RepID=UPI000C06842C|nr:hypothetical protein [Bacillus sp. Marseille-P3800]